jgi:hypothetical protein
MQKEKIQNPGRISFEEDKKSGRFDNKPAGSLAYYQEGKYIGVTQNYEEIAKYYQENKDKGEVFYKQIN